MRRKITITVDEWMLRRVIVLAEAENKQPHYSSRDQVNMRRYHKGCITHVKKQADKWLKRVDYGNPSN